MKSTTPIEEKNSNQSTNSLSIDFQHKEYKFSMLLRSHPWVIVFVGFCIVCLVVGVNFYIKKTTAVAKTENQMQNISAESKQNSQTISATGDGAIAIVQGNSSTVNIGEQKR